MSNVSLFLLDAWSVSTKAITFDSDMVKPAFNFCRGNIKPGSQLASGLETGGGCDFLGSPLPGNLMLTNEHQEIIALGQETIWHINHPQPVCLFFFFFFNRLNKQHKKFNVWASEVEWGFSCLWTGPGYLFPSVSTICAKLTGCWLWLTFTVQTGECHQ